MESDQGKRVTYELGLKLMDGFKEMGSGIDRLLPKGVPENRPH